MRYYGIRKQKLCEKLNFHYEKCKKYLSYQCCLNKKTKEIRKMVYEDWFCTGVKRFHRDNGIPEGMYYVPFGIIMSDIISKENLPDLEQGLLALEKERSTHKYWGAAQSEEEIIHGLHNIDKTFSSWNSFINLGRFDFETDSVLKNIVSHFDVYLRNVNSSFLAIEFHIFFAPDYLNKLQELIEKDFVSPIGFMTTHFQRTKQGSGSKRHKGVMRYNDAAIKSDTLYETLQTFSWVFFERMQCYCQTIIYRGNTPPPMMMLCKTNISYKDTADTFFHSVGVYDWKGQFITPSEKVYFEMGLSKRYEDQSSVMIYLVNDMTLQLKEGYHSLEFQISHELAHSANASIFKLLFLKSLAVEMQSKIAIYRNKLNMLKLKRSNLSSFLKIRYQFEKEIDTYIRYAKQTDWGKTSESVAEFFDNKTRQRGFDYRVLTESVVIYMHRLLEEIDNLRCNCESKIEVSRSLAAYKNEKKAGIINYVMLIATLITLILLIFPEWVPHVAQTLRNVVNAIVNWLHRNGLLEPAVIEKGDLVAAKVIRFWRR